MRLFFALPLSPNEADDLASVARPWCEQQRAGRDWKMIPPANYHLTLAFLGSMDDSTLPQLQAVGGQVAEQCTPFELTLETLSGFPERHSASILAARPAASRQLSRLQSCLVDRLSVSGFDLAGHTEFLPHVTLARHSKGEVVAAEQAIACSIAVDKLVLFVSENDGRGVCYRPISVHSLAESLR